MPRRDLTEERTEQILNAFERCVARYGLDGSSLEKIGEEAGMKRTILRHYIGNRDDLVHALCERMTKEWHHQLRSLELAPVGKDPQKELVGLLFYSPEHNRDSILVAENLIAAADRYPKVGEAMRDFVEAYTKVISQRLKIIHPKSPAENRWQAAYAILSILFNEASLAALNMPPKYLRAAKAGVFSIIDSLSNQPT